MPAPTPSMPHEDRRTITCLFGHRPQEVARLAMSITCRHCHKPLKLDALTITHYEARRQIATCGVLTVEKRGSVVADSILCGRLVVQGTLKGNIQSQGPVLFGRDAQVKGDVTAPSLAVGAGAVLEGQYEIGPQAAPPLPAP